MTWVGERTARACIAHLLDVRVHFWPEIAKANRMKGAIGIEMSTEWVGMECNKDNIKQCLGNYLQSSV
jgi:hypothetical protein